MYLYKAKITRPPTRTSFEHVLSGPSRHLWPLRSSHLCISHRSSILSPHASCLQIHLFSQSLQGDCYTLAVHRMHHVKPQVRPLLAPNTTKHQFVKKPDRITSKLGAAVWGPTRIRQGAFSCDNAKTMIWCCTICPPGKSHSGTEPKKPFERTKPQFRGRLTKSKVEGILFPKGTVQEAQV